MSTYDTQIRYETFSTRYDTYCTIRIAYHTILTTMIIACLNIKISMDKHKEYILGAGVELGGAYIYMCVCFLPFYIWAPTF